MEPFTVETSISQQDYQHLMLRLLLRERKSLRIMLILLAILLPIGLVAQLIAPGATMKDFAGAILPLLLLVPLLFLLRFAVARQINKTYHSHKALQHPVHYTFDETAISSNGAGFEGSISWGNIARKSQVGDWLLLYTSNASAIIVSTAAMSPEQRSFIANKTGSVPKQ